MVRVYKITVCGQLSLFSMFAYSARNETVLAILKKQRKKEIKQNKTF